MIFNEASISFKSLSSYDIKYYIHVIRSFTFYSRMDVDNPISFDLLFEQSLRLYYLIVIGDKTVKQHRQEVLRNGK